MPDLNPLRIFAFYEEAIQSRQGLQGVLVSQHVGVKVFANTMSLMFGFAPTKCKILKVLKNEATEAIDIEEIPSKGASDLRLSDYGITQESIVFFIPTNGLGDQDYTVMNNAKKTI